MVFDNDGMLTDEGKQYLAELYNFFSAIGRSKTAMIDELIFEPSGKGGIRRDGVLYFAWDSLEDCHKQIAKMSERLMAGRVDWLNYYGGYILEIEEMNYFYITPTEEICIPDAGEKFAKLERIVKESIEKGERPAK